MKSSCRLEVTVIRALLFRPLLIASAAIALLCLSGCQLGGTASRTSPPPSGTTSAPTGSTKTVTINPTSVNFGNVLVGATAVSQGTITANQSVTISSASWNGSGYALSGITFPLTITAGQSVPFTVSFTPQGGGAAAGAVSFISDSSNSPTSESLTGTGIHNVSLSWNSSSTAVAGYNVYRSSQSGGPYSKLNGSLQTGANYSDQSVQAGQTYYYVTTAVDTNQVESAYSNQAIANVPVP